MFYMNYAKSKLLLLTGFGIVSACGHSTADRPGPQTRRLADSGDVRAMFDAGGQEVITPFMNPKQQEVSILYGNTAARQAFLDTVGHRAGELFTLATWEQADDIHWYGSNLNGKLKRVEIVNVLADSLDGVEMEYKLVKGNAPVGTDGQLIDGESRIRSILGQRPAVFP